MVDAYDARGTRTPDWRNRMDQVASRLTEGRSKQTVSTMLAPPHEALRISRALRGNRLGLG